MQRRKFSRQPDLLEELQYSITIPEKNQDLIIESKDKKFFYSYIDLIQFRAPKLYEMISNQKTTQTQTQNNQISINYNSLITSAMISYLHTGINMSQIIQSNPQLQKIKKYKIYKLAQDWGVKAIQKWFVSILKWDLMANNEGKLDKSQEEKNKKSNQIRSKALLMISKFKNDLVMREALLDIIDDDINKILEQNDYLYIEDDVFQEILVRDTLNISSEFDLFIAVCNYGFQHYYNKDEFPKHHQIILPEDAVQNLRLNLIKFIRFGDMSFQEISKCRAFNVLYDEEISDILDFLESKEDGEFSLNNQFAKKYSEVYWFKPPRFHFDYSSPFPLKNFPDSPYLNYEISLQKNLSSNTEEIFNTHKHTLSKWIGEEIIQKMSLGFSVKNSTLLTAREFHHFCDGKGPTLVLIESDSLIFAGYTSVGWKSPQFSNNPQWDPQNTSRLSEDFIPIKDSQAQIGFLRYNINEQEKYPIKPDRKHNAIFYHSNFGPIFGEAWDTFVDCDLKFVHYNIGDSYKLPENQNQKEFFQSFIQNERLKIEKLVVYFEKKNK
ncbi:btb/poz domain-containing [Anaeramoeba ignava]|uniref:Btb/poz domain-containing n=1 Tax=Anaeramoeba ignava TaxID=1746090 RepID=A0A9Q0R9M4_ANAIG|nr:btb/poz domain-containing [Anaeramoeba ignava]